MAMRGDDILAYRLDDVLGIRFLKGEVKSSARLREDTVSKARIALLANGGRPTPHALAFISDRLAESGNHTESDLLDEYSLRTRIKIQQISHLLFVFTGNDPRPLLTTDLESYKGRITQRSVGVRVVTHQQFIKDVFEKVVADAKGS
jgi:hypothetical protein